MTYPARAWRTGAAVLLAFLAAAATAAAQQAPAPQPASSSPAVEAPAAATPEVYSYNPEGRRDPFVSLLRRGAEIPLNQGNRPGGREGLMIGEVSIRGIVRSRSALVAMIQGPDNKTYIIHPGDKMLDGVVKAITPETVVFAQDVNDPLSVIKQREVRKSLRAPEEGK